MKWELHAWQGSEDQGSESLLSVPELKSLFVVDGGCRPSSTCQNPTEMLLVVFSCGQAITRRADPL